jgi:hypothetical protein
MGPLFGVLAFLVFVAMIVGLIKPSWVKAKDRKLVFLGFGFLFVVFLIVAGVSTPSSPTPTAATTPTTAAGNTPQDPPSQIKAIVTNVLQGQTNESGENKLRSITVATDTDDSYDVLVEFNANNNFTNSMAKNGIEIEMSDVYIALYTSAIAQKIKIVDVKAYLPLTDKYGNTQDGVVYGSVLDGSDAAQINWSVDKATLELQILPGVWTTTIVNSSFQ